MEEQSLEAERKALRKREDKERAREEEAHEIDGNACFAKTTVATQWGNNVRPSISRHGHPE